MFCLSNNSTKVIYTDIKKAFDFVSHIELITTLSQYNFHSSLVSWLEEFLNNRAQKVVINNAFKKFLPIFTRVPKGGVISPLLLVIYIND